MFRIFKSVTIVLCAFFVFTLTTNAQPKTNTAAADTLRLSLTDAINMGLQKNLTRQNNDLDVLYARKQVNILTANGLPQVNATVNYQRFLQLPISLVPAEFFGGAPGEFAEIAFGTKNTLSAGAQASQLLFSGSFFIALQAAKRLVEQAELQTEATDNQIKDAIARTYFSGLIVQENIGIFQKNIGVLAQVLTETEALYKAGFVENLDVDRLKLQLANLKTQQTALSRQLESVYNLLKLQLVMDLNQPIALSQNLREFIDPNDLTRQIDTLALYNRIELQQLEMSDKLNELGIKQLYATRLPTVSAFLSYERRFQSNDFDLFSDRWFPTAVTGLQVNVPIFDGLSRKNQIAQRFINKKKIQNGRTQLLNSFNLEIAQAKIAYQNAIEQLKSQEETAALAQKIYNVSLTKYKEGVGSSLELTDAESKLFQNQGLYTQALYNLLIAQTDLRKAMGLYY